MDNIELKRLAERYKGELMDNVLPFWLEKSQDKEYGGYFSCLNRDVEKRQEWLDAAIQGAEFLKKYGHDGN